MPLTALVLIAALSHAEYVPSDHLAVISRRLKEVAPKVKAVIDDGAPASSVGALVGKYLGEDRKNQAALTAYLRKAKGSESVVALRTVCVAGLWQAYLSAAVLAMDGDEDSRDLCTVLERRIGRMVAGKAG